MKINLLHKFMSLFYTYQDHHGKFLAGKAPTVPTTSLVWRNQNLFETCSLHLCGLFYTWILKPEPRMALIFMDSQTRNFAIFQDFKSLFQSELLFSNFWTEVFQFLKNNKIFCLEIHEYPSHPAIWLKIFDTRQTVKL
jgi:hypothetical protein